MDRSIVRGLVEAAAPASTAAEAAAAETAATTRNNGLVFEALVLSLAAFRVHVVTRIRVATLQGPIVAFSLLVYRAVDVRISGVGFVDEAAFREVLQKRQELSTN